jgi:hypothetical protein
MKNFNTVEINQLIEILEDIKTVMEIIINDKAKVSYTLVKQWRGDIVQVIQELNELI